VQELVEVSEVWWAPGSDASLAAATTRQFIRAVALPFTFTIFTTVGTLFHMPAGPLGHWCDSRPEISRWGDKL
jgi:hypothetical protein